MGAKTVTTGLLLKHLAARMHSGHGMDFVALTWKLDEATGGCGVGIFWQRELSSNVACRMKLHLRLIYL